MSDSSIPPKPPATPVTAAANNTPKDGTQRLLDEAAPVKQIPADIANSRLPLHLDGKVVSQNRDTGETRIATPRGDVIITTPKQLEKGAEVGLDITRTRENGLSARVSAPRLNAPVRERTDTPPASSQPQRPPAPPLKPGDTVAALVIEEEPAAPPAAPSPDRSALQRAAAVIERMSAAEFAKLPQPLPVPPKVAADIAAAPDRLAALLRLPPAQQQAVIDYLARPDVAAKLPQLAPLPSPPAVTEERAPEMPPLPAPPTMGKGNTPPPTNVGALRNLMPLLESLQGAAPGDPLMPRTAAEGNTPKGLQGLLPTMQELRIITITPPGERPPTPQAGQRLGVVEFLTTNGQPSIRAGGDSLLLKQAASIEVGSHIMFEASPMTPRQVMAAFPAPTPIVPGFAPLLASTWPALQDAADALAASAAATAQALQNTLPSPSPKLVPAALFFLAALRSGAVESWLGEPVLQALRQGGKPGIVERLAGDFGKISAQAKEPLTGEWRGISMPMLHDGEISQMQFYIRRQQQDDAPEQDDDLRATPPTRFVLNLHLSRMGDLQLDGLLRKKTFDIILRSADSLPESMRRELMGSFAKGLAQAEMQGGISFQTRNQGWVVIDTGHQDALA